MQLVQLMTCPGREMEIIAGQWEAIQGMRMNEYKSPWTQLVVCISVFVVANVRRRKHFIMRTQNSLTRISWRLNVDH